MGFRCAPLAAVKLAAGGKTRQAASHGQRHAREQHIPRAGGSKLGQEAASQGGGQQAREKGSKSGKKAASLIHPHANRANVV